MNPKIYTKSGELTFELFNFPDGQPHFRLVALPDSSFNEVTVEMGLLNPHDLLMMILINDVLRNFYAIVNLKIRYLYGARMDRAINYLQPFTLQAVARMINGCGFASVEILDVHSAVALNLIKNSKNILPKKQLNQALTTLGGTVLGVVPDKGAVERVRLMVEGQPIDQALVYCTKERDPNNGMLGMETVKINDPGMVEGRNVIIIDDICDGGRTFTNLAGVLKAAGAIKVNLFITHGIFSNGLPLRGIDQVFVTDSRGEMFNARAAAGYNCTYLKVEM